MEPYTLTLSEATAQLHEVYRQAKTAHRPVMLTEVETSEPILILVKVDEYEKLRKDQRRFYYSQLSNLRQCLDRVEEQWDERSKKECITTWQKNLQEIWNVCPERMQELCASLMLSVKHLQTQNLTTAQIKALRYCWTLMQDTDPSIEAEGQAYQFLIESGIPPRLGFDQSLAQSYIDEL